MDKLLVAAFLGCFMTPVVKCVVKTQAESNEESVDTDEYEDVVQGFGVSNTEDIEKCKCSCIKDRPICSDRESSICRNTCILQCTLGEHTLDEEGYCKNWSLCTCMASDEREPVCAFNTEVEGLKTFTNLRNMYCYNLCHDHIYEYELHGICEDIMRENLAAMSAERPKETDDRPFWERLNFRSKDRFKEYERWRNKYPSPSQKQIQGGDSGPPVQGRRNYQRQQQSQYNQYQRRPWHQHQNQAYQQQQYPPQLPLEETTEGRTIFQRPSLMKEQAKKRFEDIKLKYLGAKTTTQSSTVLRQNQYYYHNSGMRSNREKNFPDKNQYDDFQDETAVQQQPQQQPFQHQQHRQRYWHHQRQYQNENVEVNDYQRNQPHNRPYNQNFRRRGHYQDHDTQQFNREDVYEQQPQIPFNDDNFPQPEVYEQQPQFPFNDENHPQPADGDVNPPDEQVNIDGQPYNVKDRGSNRYNNVPNQIYKIQKNRNYQQQNLRTKYQQRPQQRNWRQHQSRGESEHVSQPPSKEPAQNPVKEVKPEE